MYRKRNNEIASIIMPYLIGALIGATVALLLAPQSGKDTVNMIRNKSMDIKDKTVSTVEDTRSKAGKAIGDLSEQTKGSLSSITKRGQDIVNTAKQNIGS